MIKSAVKPILYIVFKAKAEGEVGPRRIITKHKEARADEFGISSWRILDSPSIQVAPIIMHQPRYSMSKLVVHKTKGKAERMVVSPENRVKCDVGPP